MTEPTFRAIPEAFANLQKMTNPDVVHPDSVEELLKPERFKAEVKKAKKLEKKAKQIMEGDCPEADAILEQEARQRRKWGMRLLKATAVSVLCGGAFAGYKAYRGTPAVIDED